MSRLIHNSVVLFILLLTSNITLNAQLGSMNSLCKGEFNEAIKNLEPYVHNGQINNARLDSGKTVEFNITIYKGLRYRFEIISSMNLGAVNFKVYTENKKEVYNSTGSDESFWDFFSNSSQTLVVEISSPEKTQKGCVGVVVGILSPNKKNPIRDL